MGTSLSAFAVSELRARGVMLAALGVVLAAAGVALHGASRLEEAFIGAVLFGGWMYWTVRTRIGSVLAQAGPVRAAVSESAADTQWRTVYQTAPALGALLVLAVAFRDIASVAGIPLGVGLALLALSTRLRAWESDNALVLLHQLAPGLGSWSRWLGPPDPADYALCAETGVHPAVTGTSAKRI